MAGPWEKFAAPTVAPAATPPVTQGPWNKFGGAASAAPSPVTDELGIEVIQPDDYLNQVTQDPEALQGRIDQNAAQRGAAVTPMVPKDEVLKSQSEIYDKVRNSPKYQKLNQYENSLLYKAVGDGEISVGGYGFNLPGTGMPPELKAMQQARDNDLQRAYLSTGEQGPMGLGRVQTARENNPSFDPSIPEGPENPAMADKRYWVDPPTMTAMERMGYQVFENIVGGGADMLQGKFTTEGTVGSALPDTVPEGGAEKFATEATTFILGPTVLGKAVGGAAKAASPVASLGAKMGQMLSPEAMNAARTVYSNVLSKTGDATKAFQASNSYVKRALVGATMGLKTGAAEMAVAPDNSEGLVPPEWIEKEYGWTKERARDMSMLIDTPIVGTVTRSLGAVYHAAKDRVVAPAIGGLRTFEPFGVGLGRMIPMSEKQAGLATITWLDPNMVGLAPEDAAFKIKILGDALERNAVKDAQLAGANQQVKQDSATAFTGIAKDYYELAYANLKDEMGPEDFARWVDDQATATANRLYELRTSVMGETEVATQAAKGARQIDTLFKQGADNMTPNGLIDAQMRAGQEMTNTQIGKMADSEGYQMLAQSEADAARKAADNAITDDPEFRLFMDEIPAELGSKRALEEPMARVEGKTYKALADQKKGVDDAYKAIGDSGAEGDPVSLLEIIRGKAEPVETTTGMGALDNDPEAKAMFEKMGGKVSSASSGDEGKKVFIKDPALRRVAEKIEEDPSFGNLYNNVRKDIRTNIKRLEKANNTQELDTWYRLRDNIENDQLDFVASQGDDLNGLVNDARQKFVNLRTAWYDNKGLGTVADTGIDRYKADPAYGSKSPVGPDGRPQGQTDFKIELSRHINHGLEGTEGAHYLDSLTRATKLGGQDISPELSDLYATKAVANLSSKMQAGDKVSTGSLIQTLNGIIEPMERLNSPMVGKFKALKTRLESLENVALNKEEYLTKVKDEVKLMQDEAAASIFNKFVYKGRESLDQGAVGKTMSQVFNNPKSTNMIREMMTEADKLGDQGTIIKDAVRASYLANIGDRLKSKSRMGIADISEDGAVENAFKINETNFEKVFAPGSVDMNNMELLYKDQPEVIDEIKDVSNAYLNITKTTPASRKPNFKLPREMNPEYAANTITTLVFGPLSRTGTQVRKVAGPLSADTLDQVKAANHAAMLAMLVDPKEFARISRDVRQGIINEKNQKDLAALVRRGLARSTTAGLPDEMAELK